MYRAVTVISLFAIIVAVSAFQAAPRKYNQKLSDYGFFSDLNKQIPAAGVIPYDLNTPLFSDYASKKRFIKVPEGSPIAYNDSAVFDMPVGTNIIKTFYYPVDARKPAKGEQLIETRLLIHEEEGWVALPYIWNEEQSDAVLSLAGDIKQVNWTNNKGKNVKLDYLVPNKNQCKGCHIVGQKLLPIGPAARHLHKDYVYGDDNIINQLKAWSDLGILANLPTNLSDIPNNANWEDRKDLPIELVARSWLDINCGHCHNPTGPANTSGLLLDIHQTDPSKFGVNKPPIAAGRGSGKLKYDIVPGKPEASILIYRMESNDPGIRMPEIGRSIAHQEGLTVIKEWIRTMK